MRFRALAAGEKAPVGQEHDGGEAVGREDEKQSARPTGQAATTGAHAAQTTEEHEAVRA